MNDRISRFFRLGARAAPAPLLGLALFASPAVVRSQPWVGLSGVGAQLHLEQGEGHHGPGAADYFGLALAAGDFNGDGAADLATGIPGNDCDFVVWDCGSVQVRFGWSENPLLGYLTLDPAHPDAPDPAEAVDNYGRALAAGDFNADGYDDLAVGAPYNGRDGQHNVDGAVMVHYGLHGSLGSIQWAAEHVIRQGDGFPDPEGRDTEIFGSALAVGDFNGDGHDDLAVGDPYYTDIQVGSHGRVFVGHGHIGGLRPFDHFEMYLGHDGLPDEREYGELFGWSLAAGDFNGDTYDDLAIGVPEEDGTGAVLVVYGSPDSLIFALHWYIGQFELGDDTALGDRFGATLAAGDFDGDGFDDLAIGATGEDGPGGSPADSGAVFLVYGSGSGLTPVAARMVTQTLLFGSGHEEPRDYFGSALAFGDFDGDGREELAIGTPGEDGHGVDQGRIALVLGQTPREGPLTARWIDPGPGGMIPDSALGEPGYGAALVAADFDADGRKDLAIGAPRRDASGEQPDTGGVAVLYAADPPPPPGETPLFADGFESGHTGAWGD